MSVGSSRPGAPSSPAELPVASVLLRWARKTRASALAVVDAGGFALRYRGFDELDAASNRGLRWLSGPHSRLQYGRLAELALHEAQSLLRAGQRELRARYERLDGGGAIELRLERVQGIRADLVIAMAHATPARAPGPSQTHDREELQREEKLEAMGIVAAGVAHDLNHFLNVIALRLARMRLDPQLALAEDRLAALQHVADEAAATVERLQDLARRRRDSPSVSLELRPVIEAAVEAARSEMEETWQTAEESHHRAVRIECDLPELPSVLGSAPEVGHVFLDLLLNARDAMPEGGVVHVRARREGDRVRVIVEDQGPGIPEPHLMRVFDPFFTLSATRDTGLGLSIAAGVMGRLGGSIAVNNRPGGGSSFALSFPIAKAPPQATPPAAPQAPARPLSVLLVDDEPDNLEVLKELLELDGHTVYCAQTGRCALDQLRSGGPFELVLCDVGMPGMSGWQVVREAKLLDPGLRIYMLTGWANEISRSDPRTGLVRGVLGKPLDLERLRVLLAEVAREVEAAGPGAPDGSTRSAKPHETPPEALSPSP